MDVTLEMYGDLSGSSVWIVVSLLLGMRNSRLAEGYF